MKHIHALGVVALAAIGLAGCENNAASYIIDNSQDHSIAFQRDQNIPWVGAVKQYLVVARAPECRRRFPVAEGTSEMAPVELFAVQPMLYAAHQGKDWYALSTEHCLLQKFDKPPEVIPPGQALGRFEKRDGNLVFTPAKP